jgi:hypothetical protein
MMYGLDTSVVVATELASHPRHNASRALLDRLVQGTDALAMCFPMRLPRHSFSLGCNSSARGVSDCSTRFLGRRTGPLEFARS